MAKVSLRAYNREIETMMDRGQLDEAVAHCHHILKKYPKHLETYRLLGKLYLELKSHSDAEDIFTRVLNAEPNDFVAQVGMSIIRDEANILDDAIWHMERAFETQPSNAAIQGELQRLYGRREGVQPPRIRMTRGALAHMYVRGELYPQAISEIKNILAEDPGRSDMQALLALAYYSSGRKNDAANEASALLKRYPYCLDSNRVLVEILGADRPEAAQLYRQRVVELDPYAGQVNGTIFQSSEVSDAAVTLERLDWNGQPTKLGSDWRSTQAIGLESGETTETTLPPPSMPVPVPAFKDTSSAPAEPTAEPAEPLPDFIREAGWVPSSGEFDESKSMFSDEVETPSEEHSIEKGELPDWLKQMAPPEAAQPLQEEEEIPDWINKIGTEELPIPTAGSSTDSQSDWLSQAGDLAVASTPSSDEQPDWMKGFDQAEEQPVMAPASDEALDWLKGFGEESEATPSAPIRDRLEWMEPAGQTEEQLASASVSDETPDWLKSLDEEPESTPAEAATDLPDWLSQVQAEPELSSVSTDQLSSELDFLAPLGGELDSIPAELQTSELDILSEPSIEPEQPVISTSQPAMVDTGELGKSEQERDDSFAWLEALAAKQGATEGLLTQPEERLEKEPEWIEQVKRTTRQLAEPQPSEIEMHPLQMEEPVVEPLPVELPITPVVSVEELGKSEQERDDSFAWLEALAARQGATEGLLTQPEERLEKEPEWIEQVRRTTGQLFEQQPPEAPPLQMEEPVIEPLPVEPPVINVDELGRSEQERDDSFGWLEALAAKQGATEGLLTQPEERLEQEPDWVKQAKDLGVVQPPVEAPSLEEAPFEPQAVESAEKIDELGKSEQERDDSFAWLENLAAKQGVSEGLLTTPEERLEEEPEWVRQAKELHVPEVSEEMTATFEQETGLPAPERVPAVDDTAEWLRELDEEPERVSASATDDTMDWIKILDEPEKVPPSEPEQVEDLPAWLQSLDEENPPAAESVIPEKEAEEPVVPSEVSGLPAEFEELPSWLSGLEEEGRKVPSHARSDELPAWLRDETGEWVAEPPKIEPTRAADWHTMEEAEEESPAPVAPTEPQPALEHPEPAPPPKEKKPAARKAKPASPPSGIYKEPVTIKGTGMLSMPLDPILESARNELSRSNIPGALETYGKMIKKGRFLDEVIYDLREALYRYPVEVSIWQALGDAYMRANRLQDALDAYTKAEELLR